MQNVVDFLTGNLILNLAIMAWAAAQILKLIVVLITERRWDWQHILSSGGMPSSHSAFVCAMASSIAYLYGWGSPLFAIATGVALVVMYDAFNVRRETGEQAKILNYMMEHWAQMKPEELFQVADQIQESAAGYRTWEEWSKHILEYKEQLLEQARDRGQKREGVALMTMHSAKGLEFKIVYILDANEGVTPHHKAFLDADMEEERRMFYVAMTRAKSRLVISYVKEKNGKDISPSRFIEELLLV